MKKMKWMTLLLAAAMLTGCGGSEAPVQEEAKQDVQAEEQVEKDEAQQEQADVYEEQISAYRTALAEKWEMESYFERDMSSLAIYYYENNGLENVGYALMDLNFDGSDELVIGAIEGADTDPVIFELWTLDASGAPVKLLTSQERNRYYLGWGEEGVYTVENQASNGAANFAHHYYTLTGGALQVQQAIVFDAAADEENPWFMAYDEDWDVSNDTPIEEELAMSIMDSYTKNTIIPDYTPLSE